MLKKKKQRKATLTKSQSCSGDSAKFQQEKWFEKPNSLLVQSLHMICYVKAHFCLFRLCASLGRFYERRIHACHKLILLQSVLRACFCRQLWKWIFISFFLKKKKKENMICMWSLTVAQKWAKSFICAISSHAQSKVGAFLLLEVLGRYLTCPRSSA